MTVFDVRRWRSAALVESWGERIAVAVETDGWHRDALCGGLTDLMYPDTAGETRSALEVCQLCPVRLSCLAEARDAETGEEYVFGVRGGLTARQRVARYSGAAGPIHPLVQAIMDADDYAATPGAAA